MNESIALSDFYADRTSAGGINVICRECGPSVLPRADLASFEPTESDRQFLLGLDLPAIRCQRCGREVAV